MQLPHLLPTLHQAQKITLSELTVTLQSLPSFYIHTSLVVKLTYQPNCCEGEMGAFLTRLMEDDLATMHPTFVESEMDLDDSSDEEDGTGSADNDPFDFAYSNLPENTHILEHAVNCLHCEAKRFEFESQGFCCRNGQTELTEPEPIPELMRLWSAMDADSRHFRDNIRFFNGHFSFTTLGVTLDSNCTNMRSGVYTFRACGSVYRNVHSFGPGSRPEHLQLYFYDDDPTLSHRAKSTENLDQSVVKLLVDILKDNPYSKEFRRLGEHKENLDEYRIELNTDQKLDQRRYNKPLSSEVAAIWVEGNNLARRFERSITLHGNDNQRYGIQATQGCYDPLSYPLFFPNGELGWHPNIPKHKTPWALAQQSRANRDDDAGSPFPYTFTFSSYHFHLSPNFFVYLTFHRWK